MLSQLIRSSSIESPNKTACPQTGRFVCSDYGLTRSNHLLDVFDGRRIIDGGQITRVTAFSQCLQ
jgi:hypothetical protein